MTIHYGCIARGTNVLCSNQVKNGDFGSTLQSMLPNISTQTDSKRTYTSDNYEYHCMIENGILFVCVTNSGVAKSQPYGFLNEIKKRLQSGPLISRAMTAGPGDLDKDFNFVLSQQMQKYTESGAGAGNSTVATVQAQVEEVKGVMYQNIEKVMQRGDRLEDLLDKSEELEAGAVNFSRTAKKIQKRYWWRNKKMTIILVVVALVIILIITLIILFSTGVLPPKSDSGATTHKP